MKKPSEITVADLQAIPYRHRSTFNGPTIDGVRRKDLKTIVDGRGDVIELWSLPWVEAEGFAVPQHAYQSATDYGVVKCWHLHEIHTDQFTVTRGKLQVVCVDLRESSPTYGEVNSFITGIQRPSLILIPPGVMHGWKALAQPETIVVNFQTMPYDAADEFKFPWNCVLEDVWEPKNG
ncbi:MAG: dTDP-4-dehydrorhamnose 3,5-epimerase [Chlorobi bacterium]|nr:dTDP-4-dehydrorhamnose 3,5-epimerase [Chlorobiota bacterium]